MQKFHTDDVPATLILVMLLIDWNFVSTNQKHYQDVGNARHQYGISALVTQTSFCEGSSDDLVKLRLFSQAMHLYGQNIRIIGPLPHPPRVTIAQQKP